MTQIYRCNYFAKFTSEPLFFYEIKLKILEVLSVPPPPSLEVATVFRFVSIILLHILYLDHSESINNI